MISTTETAAGAAAGTDTVVDLRGMWIGLVVLDVFYLIVRIYEQVFGWRAGLDSFAPEFQTYWLSILWTEIPLELVSALAWPAICGRPAIATSTRLRRARRCAAS